MNRSPQRPTKGFPPLFSWGRGRCRVDCTAWGAVSVSYCSGGSLGDGAWCRGFGFYRLGGDGGGDFRALSSEGWDLPQSGSEDCGEGRSFFGIEFYPEVRFLEVQGKCCVVVLGGDRGGFSTAVF